jgi:UDP-N-acetylmuramate--alanine ligase
MAGVGFLAEKMGYKVTGCDLEESTAYANNIYKGHDKSHLKDADFLVVSPAIYFQNLDNPELAEGKKRGIVFTWEEFLGRYLVEDKKVICVAGTHGKSTTTAMVGKMLIDAGFDPSVIVGAKVPEWNGNARYGKGEYFVIEADEFNNNFLNYHPDIAIINNIEFDHPDFFKSEKEVRESFDKFVKNLKGDKILITSEDSPHKHFNLKVLGEHNQKNANMVYALGRKLGISDEEIVRSLETFSGLERRMELIADLPAQAGKNGVKVYDDYAHHPTAIKATLEGVREKYPNAKILVIDEPHGYKRTKALLSEYKGVFDSADKAVIGPIFQARDEIDESVTPQKVARTSNHKNAFGLNSFEEIIEKLSCKAGSGFAREIDNYDVIVVMGAGKSYLWARKVVEMLK